MPGRRGTGAARGGGRGTRGRSARRGPTARARLRRCTYRPAAPPWNPAAAGARAALRALCSASISVPSTSSRTPAAAGFHGGPPGGTCIDGHPKACTSRRPTPRRPASRAATSTACRLDGEPSTPTTTGFATTDSPGAGPDRRRGRPAPTAAFLPAFTSLRHPASRGGNRRANRPRARQPWRGGTRRQGVRLEEQ
ncbi:hypothetical protein SAFG77S_00904 [Streptomyces afghaniensis]